MIINSSYFWEAQLRFISARFLAQDPHPKVSDKRLVVDYGSSGRLAWVRILALYIGTALTRRRLSFTVLPNTSAKNIIVHRKCCLPQLVKSLSQLMQEPKCVLFCHFVKLVMDERTGTRTCLSSMAPRPKMKSWSASSSWTISPRKGSWLQDSTFPSGTTSWMEKCYYLNEQREHQQDCGL